VPFARISIQCVGWNQSFSMIYVIPLLHRWLFQFPWLCVWTSRFRQAFMRFPCSVSMFRCVFFSSCIQGVAITKSWPLIHSWFVPRACMLTKDTVLRHHEYQNISACWFFDVFHAQTNSLRSQLMSVIFIGVMTITHIWSDLGM